jgi:hypothetical protein
MRDCRRLGEIARRRSLLLHTIGQSARIDGIGLGVEPNDYLILQHAGPFSRPCMPDALLCKLALSAAQEVQQGLMRDVP